MKKLIVFVCLLFFAFNGYSQCGIISGIQPETNLGSGSHFNADYILDPGWNIYSYQWKINGMNAGTTQNILNTGRGYDDVCLTIKATNPITGDSCESKYCQLYYTVYPWLASVNIIATPSGPLTMQFSAKICGSMVNQITGTYSWDFGDGNTSGAIAPTHTYADSGTYEVTLNYYQPIMAPISTIYETKTRKVYVDNGPVNYMMNVTASSANCFSVNSTVGSTPAFINGGATELDNFPFSTGYVSFQSGVPFTKNYYGTGVDVIQYMKNDALGNLVSTCAVVALPDCKILPDTMSGTVWLDDDADGLWDAGEGIYNGTGYADYTTGNYRDTVNFDGTYSLPIPQTPAWVSLGGLPSTFLVTSNHYHETNNLNNSTNHPGYNFGVVNKGVNICGKAFIDKNVNSIFDAGIDINYNSVVISVFNTTLNRTFSTLTDQSGNYCIALPVGNYIIKAFSNNLDSAFVVPDSIILNTPNPGTFINNNFGFQTPVQGGNLGVILNMGGMPRPGFDYSLNSYITNSGVDTTSGTVVLNYSPTLIYVNSSFGGVHNATNKTVTWQTSIAPASSKYFSANFTVPIPTPLGTVLTSNCTVTTNVGYTDYDLTNNTSTQNNIVVGSYDPNDKLVTPFGVGANGDVLHSQRLYYRINFQNTGTASAINIIVQDSIDSNLDMTSFRMERTSHIYNYTTVILDNIITWKFFNINLPDSNTNEPQSHGFIEFSIKPKQGLPDGTIISNDAEIYFDFNPPIITNVVSNTLQTSLTGISENEMDLKFSAFPNPFRNEIFIKTFNEKVKTITVYDLCGKIIYFSNEIKVDERTIKINTDDIAAGIYFLKLESNNGVEVKKMLKQ